MVQKLRSAILAVSLLALAGTAMATAEVAANLQTKPRKLALTRTKLGVTVRATSANTIHVRACPDSANLVSSSGADSVGDCVYLSYSSSDKTWYLRKELLGPASVYGRRAFSLSFTNGAGADTLIGSGFVLDEEPGSDVVDSYAIADRTITGYDIDSTSTFIHNDLEAAHIDLRETGASSTGIYAPYGTTDATGSVIQLGGSGPSLGIGLYAKEWSGYGLKLTRKAAVASAADGVYLDMSADSDTTNIFYGMNVNFSGTNKGRGIYLRRTTGNRRTDGIGLLLDISGGTQYGGTVNYGAVISAAATPNGTSRNVALKLSATATNDGRALWTTDGDVQIGDASDTDTLLVKARSHFLGDNEFDKPIGIKGPFQGRFTLASGDSTVTVACSGIDATNYDVHISPRSNWADKVLWAVPGTNQFIVHCTVAAGADYSGAYIVVRKF